MKWEPDQCDDGSGEGWVVARTPVGDFVVDAAVCSERFVALWYPAHVPTGEVRIGDYRTQAAAKRAVKRYVKRMAAEFKALAKAGWE